MDLPHSDEGFVVAFPAEMREAFLEGHVRAFTKGRNNKERLIWQAY
jgi:hypothetical protein